MTLERRTPLGRGDKPMKRGGPIARKSAMPRSSGKAKKGRTEQQRRRADLDAEWSDYRRTVLAARPVCEAGLAFAAAGVDVRCAGRASQVHHKTPRGRGPIVPSQGLTGDACVAVCPVCHAHIHGAHSAEARTLDLLR